MAGFEEERLRILERVEAGELTPQQGSLEIAMLKVKAQQGTADAAPEADPGPRRAGPGAPNPIALGALLLVPFVVMGLIVVVATACFMLLPAFLMMHAWNGLVVPSVPGAGAVGFFQTLGAMVAFSLVWTMLRWRRKVRVFMSGGPLPGGMGGFGGFGGPGAAGPRPPGSSGLNPGDGFREQ